MNSRIAPRSLWSREEPGEPKKLEPDQLPPPWRRPRFGRNSPPAPGPSLSLTMARFLPEATEDEET